MKPLAAAIAFAGLATGGSAAHAQIIAGWNVSGQWDRGGDYRCDAYWDANRTDCDAAWRTPRGAYRHDGRGQGYGYGQTYGYGYDRYGYGRQGYGYGQVAYGYGHGPSPRAPYGSAYGHGGPYAAPAVVYPAAYGRPDLVYGGEGYGYGQGARDPRRVDWCRRAYRSYDPYSGYYRAYSGRLVWCG